MIQLLITCACANFWTIFGPYSMYMQFLIFKSLSLCNCSKSFHLIFCFPLDMQPHSKLFMAVFKSKKQNSSPSSRDSDAVNKPRFLNLLQYLQLPSFSWLTDMLNLNPSVCCLKGRVHFIYLKSFTLNQRFGCTPEWSLKLGLIVQENRHINVKWKARPIEICSKLLPAL